MNALTRARTIVRLREQAARDELKAIAYRKEGMYPYAQVLESWARTQNERADKLQAESDEEFEMRLKHFKENHASPEDY